jgi:hypothetical protein
LKYLFLAPVYNFFQSLGVHVLPKHFYSPVWDTSELAKKPELWDQPQAMPGIDLRVEGQLAFLRDVLSKYQAEYAMFPLEKGEGAPAYYLRNRAYGFTSAAVLHGIIRDFKPKRIFEIGSGFSTLVSAQASVMNAKEGSRTELVAIEPYPNENIRKGFEGLSRLEPTKVEDLAPEFFDALEANDILFIDSSHVIKMGGDVTFEILELLPRLKKGVIVHIHDIFFPYHYPKHWVLKRGRFWSEQYLVQAFLCFNPRFEILWCGSYMYANHLEEMKLQMPKPAALGDEQAYMSSSLWLKVV